MICLLYTSKVRNFTNFGVFVEIEEGVDGLIHISDLSWTKKVKHPSEFTQIGADIEVQVLEIDKENRRLSLGHKQLEENPWDVFETVFTVGSVHEGTIIEMLDKGAVVAVSYTHLPLIISSFSRAAFTRSQERVARAFLCDRTSCPFLSS